MHKGQAPQKQAGQREGALPTKETGGQPHAARGLAVVESYPGLDFPNFESPHFCAYQPVRLHSAFCPCGKALKGLLGRPALREFVRAGSNSETRLLMLCPQSFFSRTRR